MLRFQFTKKQWCSVIMQMRLARSKKKRNRATIPKSRVWAKKILPTLE
jgi:hypothetical protein